MILPYMARLFCLSLACIFLVHLAVGLVVSLSAPAALALAKRMRPAIAARFLLAVRLFPAVAAGLAVAAVCIPSYLWLEPDASFEEVGLVCLAAALLGIGICAISMGRGLRAILLSLRYGRHCRRVGQETLLGEEATPVIVVDGAAGLFAMAGIVHPRLLISRDVLRELSGEELATAVRHERGHRSSHDNLKRLLLLLTPDILPFRIRVRGGFEKLERGWARTAEWAADDLAVGADSQRSISLAAALVRVARLGTNPIASPLMTSLVADGSDLEARVDRLLGGGRGEKSDQGKPVVLCGALALVGVFGVVFSEPATLRAAHVALERLIR